MMSEAKSIGILFWMNQEYGRQVAVGVEKYAHTQHTLTVRIIPMSKGIERTPAMDVINALDGLVTTLSAGETAFLRRHITSPTVEAMPFLWPNKGVLSTGMDARSVGRLGADHLLSRRITRLALLSYEEESITELLVSGMRDAIANLGTDRAELSVYNAVDRVIEGCPASFQHGHQQPTGVLCTTDRTARLLLRAAQTAGRDVPDQIALLGVGNDPITCMAADPPLSSIRVPAEDIGFMSASLLDRSLSGRQACSTCLPPLGLVERASTATFATEDPVVRDALAFISTNYHLPITVDSVVENSRLSRRPLECRFQRNAGATIHEEITRWRLNAALALLTDTDLQIKEIAFRTGRMKIQNFTRFIKHHTGLSPTRYRARHGTRLGSHDMKSGNIQGR